MNQRGFLFLHLLFCVYLLCGSLLIVVRIAPNFSDSTQPAEQMDVLPAEESVHIKREPWDGANRVENCMVTYYCCELYEHICGDGDGYTSTGAEVTAGHSCAVDPFLIPLGSTVWVDFGDGVMHEYIAEDVGGAVNGAHIDLAVQTHAEANECGIDYATVYWK